MGKGGEYVDDFDDYDDGFFHLYFLYLFQYSNKVDAATQETIQKKLDEFR